MDKIYQVIYQDEYDNLILLGFYKSLEDAIPDINSELEEFNVSITKDDLKEYAGTLGNRFDLDISMLFDEADDLPFVKIRGFVFDKEYLMKEIEEK